MVMGALYASCLFLGVNNASSVQPIVSIERTVFYRERAAGMFSPLSYAAAQVTGTLLKYICCITVLYKELITNPRLPLQQGLVEIPYVAAQTILFGVITYFMVNFERTVSKIPLSILKHHLLIPYMDLILFGIITYFLVIEATWTQNITCALY